ncbi:hypothetical protein [Candidatus Laterigemmans baculatus]|uniref:hypothetical protein n=1 Tax=Candidatus Laterigemmans baculatus TaxID=2770505 RepID=UPI0013DCFE7F|nr:hypothetical protein [Candidatus Laterigemmans baculatus]
MQPIRTAPQPRVTSPQLGGSAAGGKTTLRWRPSSQVASSTTPAAPAKAALVPPSAAAETPTAQAPAAEAPAVARVAYLQDAADPFLDPFNDGAAPSFPAPTSQPEPLAVPPGEGRFIGQLEPPATTDGFQMEFPGDAETGNREGESLEAPNPFSPGPAPNTADSPRRLSIPSPSDQQVVQDPAGGELRDRSERAVDIGRPTSQRVEPSCDELRQRIAQRTIRKVTLDISPPFRPDILEQDEYARLRAEFLESQEIRQWRSLDGRLLGRGRLIDMAYEQVIIEGEDGAELALSMAELSEPDLEYVTSEWGLPRECQLPQIAYEPRQWLPTKMTWKASELCHKPLYFEEVNLERYGHTAGPFAQPVVSTAHFFFNIAVLPYKMGIHPPNECQYALGYYRPGNCAPWIIPPVPLSLRGAVAQTAFVGGMVALIP